MEGTSDKALKKKYLKTTVTYPAIAAAFAKQDNPKNRKDKGFILAKNTAHPAKITPGNKYKETSHMLRQLNNSIPKTKGHCPIHNNQTPPIVPPNIIKVATNKA